MTPEDEPPRSEGVQFTTREEQRAINSSRKNGLNIQKTKIMASSPIISKQIEGEKLEAVTDFIFLGSKITVGRLLLLLLSRFSRVQLCATPQTAAHQVPPSLGFSRQEHWSGLPFPSPMHESEVAQSRPTLSDPMDCSLPGSFVHGIFQAKVLEWGATAFSGGQTIAMKFCQIHTKRRSSTTTKK